MTTNSSTSSAHAASVYAQTHIEHAPPVKLVRLLYQGAIRFIDSAAECEPGAHGSKFDYWLGRADEIVLELRISIEPTHAPELAANLRDLYLFVELALARARKERSAEPLPGARAVLTRLLEAWTSIDTTGV